MAQYVYSLNRVGKIVPPKRQILKDISLSFFPGAKIGLLGLNGSGKSTLIRIMAGIIQMTSGQAASEKEVLRLLAANGLGPTATDAQLREGVGKLESQYRILTEQRRAKYHPTVVKTYTERGGYTAAPPVALSPADVSAKEWAESNPNDKRAAAILERLKAKGM